MNPGIGIIIILIMFPFFCICIPCCVYKCNQFTRYQNIYYKYKKSNRPNSRRDRLKHISHNLETSYEGCLSVVKSIGAWIRIYCPCSFNFTKKITLHDAIGRYEENLPKEIKLFMETLSENLYINFILSYINQKMPKFYLKILPSGSIRERFGYELPSTSILATDCDLMLVPDGIYVYDKDAKHDSKFPPAFTAIDDPNQNPNTPSGYLWLLLKEHKLKQWKEMCYERLMKNGGK